MPLKRGRTTKGMKVGLGESASPAAACTSFTPAHGARPQPGPRGLIVGRAWLQAAWPPAAAWRPSPSWTTKNCSSRLRSRPTPATTRSTAGSDTSNGHRQPSRRPAPSSSRCSSAAPASAGCTSATSRSGPSKSPRCSPLDARARLLRLSPACSPRPLHSHAAAAPQDKRFLRIWILYADLCTDAEDIFAFMVSPPATRLLLLVSAHNAWFCRVS